MATKKKLGTVPAQGPRYELRMPCLQRTQPLAQAARVPDEVFVPNCRACLLQSTLHDNAAGRTTLIRTSLGDPLCMLNMACLVCVELWMS